MALEQGMTLDRTLALVHDGLSIRSCFSYLNPVVAAGPDVLERAAAAGLHGILVTDLPVGVDPEREQWLGSGPLAFVRLVAPTTPDDRMREIGERERACLPHQPAGTGARDDVPDELPDTIGRLRHATSLPICVGFGISNAAQARRIGALADGIVVGAPSSARRVKAWRPRADLALGLRAALDEG